MFGHYFRTLDDKKRVVVPPKHMQVLGDTFYLTLGPDRVLELRDQKSFNIWKDKLISVNMLNANARKFARVLLGNTIEVSPDKAHRIAIPESFLKNAAITKEVVFVGTGNKVEIWPKENFDDFQAQFAGENSLDDLAKKLLKDGVEL